MKNYHWWKDKNRAWNRIAKNFWHDNYRRGNVDESGTDARLAWMFFERIAFLYELHARRDGSKKPKWFFGVPFDELHSGQLIFLEEIPWTKMPSKLKKGAGLSRGIPRDVHSVGEINLGKLFSGVYITPSRASKKGVREYLFGEVERYMRATGLSFSKRNEGEQSKPLVWSQIEFLDTLHAKKGRVDAEEHNRKRAIFSTYQSEIKHIRS